MPPWVPQLQVGIAALRVIPWPRATPKEAPACRFPNSWRFLARRALRLGTASDRTWFAHWRTGGTTTPDQRATAPSRPPADQLVLCPPTCGTSRLCHSTMTALPKASWPSSAAMCRNAPASAQGHRCRRAGSSLLPTGVEDGQGIAVSNLHHLAVLWSRRPDREQLGKTAG